MASRNNKQIIEDLKKFNDDLDKHIPGLDLDVIKDAALYKPGSKNEDYYTLFAENLIDLRTEISLLRKNLSVDIEGMIMRVVNTQQNQFAERMNDFFVKAILDAKDNWDRHLNQFADEMIEIRKSFNDLKINNENLTDTINHLTDDLVLLKSSLDGVKENLNTNRPNQSLEKVEQMLLRLGNDLSLGKRVERDVLDIGKKIESSSDEFSQDDELSRLRAVSTDGFHDVESKIIDIDSRLTKLDALKK